MCVFYGALEEQRSPDLSSVQRLPDFILEEFGEIALSLLTPSRPPNMRCDYEQTRNSWLFPKQMPSSSLNVNEDLKRPDAKKNFRVIGKSLF